VPEAPSGTLFKEFVTEKRRHQAKADAGTLTSLRSRAEYGSGSSRRTLHKNFVDGRSLFRDRAAFFFAAGTSQHAIEASFPPVLDKSEC